MRLTALTLHHFRNYVSTTIPFSAGINVIKGENGAGKTNLLEALYLLTTGRSFRTARLSDLVQMGQKGFFIEAHFEKEGVSQTLSFGFDKAKRKIVHNSLNEKSASELLGLFPLTLYAPKDGAMIVGAPSDRRRFLNIQLAQSGPLYTYHLVRYHKALKQRNALLKKKGTETMSSWEKVMAESGHYLIKKRRELLFSLKPKVTNYIEKLLSAQELFDLHYEPSILLKEETEQEEQLQLSARFEKERSRDFYLGATSLGPHRDDFLISYRSREAKVYASEGQKRCCIAALKMAEWDHLADQTGCLPLFVVDDFGIHLDKERTDRLEKQLGEFGQVLLTTPNHLFQSASYLLIVNGKLES